MTRESPTPVRTTARSFDIIETLRELDGARLTEVSAHLDLPDSTVHNHLRTLVQRGYVVRDDNTYYVSLQFLDFGEYARSRRKVYELAKSEIDKLADESEESANLLVEEGGHGVYIYNARGGDAIPLDTHPGKRVPLHATALGKVILAYLPESRVNEIFDRLGLPAETPKTITDREELRTELERVRENGRAVDDEERVPGIRCVAVAIKNENGQVIGAISVSGPASRIDADPDGSLLDDLLRAKNIIELKLAHA
ncbi:IclR family transcriptional regulator [Haladaptatus sp. AB618]|uniref:IclR family transcriptional regulator n=1 Tax=Haladaptatus sp. AB618 TaxID=2934173 RepID=UPI00209BFD52|nr:IclR family transcriptional regulator [Haladaptatus sp. AB618]MCO8256400.1 IclR family transcriptional regulator [Haladaptatus sp. AB618]